MSTILLLIWNWAECLNQACIKEKICVHSHPSLPLPLFSLLQSNLLLRTLFKPLKKLLHILFEKVADMRFAPHTRGNTGVHSVFL